MALLVTLLLSLTGVILIVRYIDITITSGKAFSSLPAGSDDAFLYRTIGAGVACLFLACSIIAILSTAEQLENWHYMLMGAEVLFVGYQTWRVFLGRQR